MDPRGSQDYDRKGIKETNVTRYAEATPLGAPLGGQERSSRRFSRLKTFSERL